MDIADLETTNVPVNKKYSMARGIWCQISSSYGRGCGGCGGGGRGYSYLVSFHVYELISSDTANFSVSGNFQKKEFDKSFNNIKWGDEVEFEVKGDSLVMRVSVQPILKGIAYLKDALTLDSSQIGKLIKELSSDDDDVEYNARFTLGILSSKSIPELIKLLKDSDGDVRKEVVDILIASFNPEETASQIGSLFTERQEKSNSNINNNLLRLIEHNDRYIRKYAINLLGSLKVKESVPILIKLLDDSDDEIREESAHALGGIQDRAAVPHLIKLFSDNDRDVRREAVCAIYDIDAREAIPDLIRLLNDSEQAIRCFTVYTLGKFNAKEAIPYLVNLLSNESSNSVRGESAEVLADLDAREAIPQIINLLKDSNRHIRQHAVSAIGKLGVKEAIPEVIKLLKDEIEDVRGFAAITLVELDAKDKVPPVLIEDIKSLSKEDAYRDRAHRALKQLGVIGQD
jgi:HEAT repeat protein